MPSGSRKRLLDAPEDCWRDILQYVKETNLITKENNSLLKELLHVRIASQACASSGHHQHYSWRPIPASSPEELEAIIDHSDTVSSQKFIC